MAGEATLHILQISKSGLRIVLLLLRPVYHSDIYLSSSRQEWDLIANMLIL